MRTFRFSIAVLLVVAGELFSMDEITTRTFSKMNCSPLENQGSYIKVKLRSRLECASACTRKTSYKYFKQTSLCRMSFYGSPNNTDGWYCVPALSTVSPVTGNCSPPFESFFSTCITHVSSFQTPFNSYTDMQKICTFIGGHLYKIQVDHRSKEEWVKSYSWAYQLSSYAIQGRSSGLLLNNWYNDDGSRASDDLLNLVVGEFLTVSFGTLYKYGTSLFMVRGVICEQI